MPDEITVSLLITIIALIIDLERRVARLETLINTLNGKGKRGKA
jgi:hypothetical protein